MFYALSQQSLVWYFRLPLMAVVVEIPNFRAKAEAACKDTPQWESFHPQSILCCKCDAGFAVLFEKMTFR